MALLLAALLALAAPPDDVTPEEQAQIAWVLERGRLLFELDRAAWVGTDDMMERFADPEGEGLRGYVVEPDGNGFLVTFYAGEGDEMEAAYQGRVERRRVVSRQIFPPGGRPALTPLQRRLVETREKARELNRRPCGNHPFNTAVIPPETPDGPADLYLLTPQMREREYPFGGHFRATISADGKVLSSRAFTNACVTLAPPPEAVGIGITHLLDPIPTEIHVFTAITSGLPVGVSAGGRVWEVTGDSIRMLARLDRP